MSKLFRISRNEDEKRKMAIRLGDELDDFKSNAGWDQYASKMVEFDQQWRARTPRNNKPWDHATEFNTHLTFSKCEDVHAVLYSFFATFNFFKSIPVSTPDGGWGQEERRKLGEHATETMRWSMLNESNAPGFLDRFIHSGVVYGAGYGELKWLRDIRDVRTEMDVPDDVQGTKLSGASSKRILEVTLGEFLRSKSIGGDNTSGYVCDFIDDDGMEKQGRFWVIDDHPMRPEGEIVVMCQRDSVTYDAPHSRVIAPWNFLVPAHVQGLQSADFYWTVDRLSPAQIVSLWRAGIFNALTREDVKKLLQKENAERDEEGLAGMSDWRGSGEPQFGEDQLDDLRDDEMAGPRKNEYQERNTIEVVFKWSVDADDTTGRPMSKIEAFTGFPGPMLLADQRLEDLFPTRRRPHVDWHLFPIDDRYAGMGIPELLEWTAREQNAMYQARSDVLEIITKPGGMYDSLSGLAPDEIRYFPGMMVKVRSPQSAFQPFQFPVQPEFLFQEQVGMDRDAERAVGSTDLGLGRNAQGSAPRTLGGTAIVVRQQQLRTEVMLKRLMYGRDDRPSGIYEWIRQYHTLLARYMPENKEILVTGEDRIQKVTRQELQGEYAFVVSFDEEINNPQIRAANAVQRYGLLAQNPLFMQNPQALWHLTQDVMRATGMPGGPAMLPPPKPQADRPLMDQDQESANMARGVYIPPLMEDNHQEHIQKIMELIVNAERLAMMGFTPDSISLLERHAQEHQSMLTMAAQSQAGGPPGGAQGQDNGTSPSVTLAQTGAGMGGSEQMELDGGLAP